MKALPVGPHAVLVEVGDTASALDLALWARGRIQAREVVPAARTVLFDGVRGAEFLLAELSAWVPGELARTEAEVEVPVSYDGPDLQVVADVWGVSPEEVVDLHLGADHVVAFCGFAPGFPYITSSLDRPEVPRRSSPRPRVDPGSVGLAGHWTGIYPTASPGGWQVIGRTAVTLFDVARAAPALLPPGSRVRFVRE